MYNDQDPQPTEVAIAVFLLMCVIIGCAVFWVEKMFR